MIDPNESKAQRQSFEQQLADLLAQHPDLTIAEAAGALHGFAYSLVQRSHGPAQALRWAQAMSQSAVVLERSNLAKDVVDDAMKNMTRH